jgi:hypothetical protein
MFPEIQIADALKCNVANLVFDANGYFPIPGTSNYCIVKYNGQILCCYFDLYTDKLKMILDDRTGDLVCRI